MRYLKLWISVLSLFALVAFGLTGCGGGGGDAAPTPPPFIPPVSSAPAAPTGLAATGGAAKVNLSWTPVAGATAYNIYWSNTTGVTTAGNPIFNVTDATTPYLHSGLADGTTYYYVVTAVNSVGESVASSQASATTTVLATSPTDVSATPGAGQVSLAWPAVAGASSYNVYWSTVADVTTTNSTKITGASSPRLVTGLNNGAKYYFRISAVTAGVESALSPEVSAIPSAAPAPASPTGVTATTFNINGTAQVNIAWTAVAGATSYNLYYSEFPGVTVANGTKMTGVTSAAHPPATGTYFVVVTAVNGNGESTVSPEVMVVPVVFTTEMLAGKAVKYTDTASGQTFNFNCSLTGGTLTFTSTLTGVPASGAGTWVVNGDGSLTVNLPTGSFTFDYEMFSISGTSAGVYFYNGSAAPALGTITIN